MKKIGFFLLAICWLGACVNQTNYKSHRKVTGIDYSAYTQAALSPADDYTGQLPQPSMLEENTPAAQPETDPAPAPEEENEVLSADEDFTSDEIAASYGRYTDVTVVAAIKRVKLGPQATTKEMNLFQQALTVAYKKALRKYRPSGFTYSMSSVGAVNPLSDVEVNCVLAEQAANEIGQQTCNLFFNTLLTQYKQLLQEEKEHAAL